MLEGTRTRGRIEMLEMIENRNEIRVSTNRTLDPVATLASSTLDPAYLNLHLRHPSLSSSNIFHARPDE
jgi:hypothetical protein